jgi:glycosyltransferase involved in cell wall biosynthesis
MRPSISIVTAVRNNASTIAHCLRSVASQTLDAEHVVIDGASSDGTLQVLDLYASPSIRVVSEPDRGIYDAMNKGIRLATGDVVGILNSDDFYAHARVLEKVADLMSDPGVDSCYGDLMYVDPCKPARVVRRWKSVSLFGKSFYWGWMPPHPTFFVRRSLYEKCGLFNLALGSAADYEMMLRLLVRYGISSAYLPEVLVKMRAGGVSNASLHNRLRANRMDRLAWEVNGLLPYPWTTVMKPLRKLSQFVV